MSRRLGEFVPLSATYADDDAILSLSPLAELLFVRGLALSAQLRSDGYLTQAQVLHRAARSLGSDRKVTDMVKELLTQGVWQETDGGYLIRSWLKWNKSSEQLGRERAKDRDRKRAERDPSPRGNDPDSGGSPSGVQPDTPRTPDGIHPDSDGSPGGVGKESGRSPAGVQSDSGGSPTSRAPARGGARRAVSTTTDVDIATARHGTARDGTGPDATDTPRTDPPAAAADKPQQPALSVTQRSKIITDAYHAIEPMCRWPAINGVVIKAIQSGKYADEEIRDALLRMAKEGRSVTVDSLRVEIDGLPPRRSGPSSGGFTNVTDQVDYDRTYRQ